MREGLVPIQWSPVAEAFAETLYRRASGTGCYCVECDKVTPEGMVYTHTPNCRMGNAHRAFWEALS